MLRNSFSFIVPFLLTTSLSACSRSDKTASTSDPTVAQTAVPNTNPNPANPNTDTNPNTAHHPDTNSPDMPALGAAHNLPSAAGSIGAAAGSAGRAALPLTDADIAAIANAANKSEVEEAQFALAHAKNSKVKEYAKHMVDAHQKATQEETALLKKINTAPHENALSRELSEESKKSLEELRDKTGDSFDQAYMENQIKDHSDVVNMFDKQLIPQAKNPALRAYLQNILPTLSDHLKEAKQIEAPLGAKKAPLNKEYSSLG